MKKASNLQKKRTKLVGRVASTWSGGTIITIFVEIKVVPFSSLSSETALRKQIRRKQKHVVGGARRGLRENTKKGTTRPLNGFGRAVPPGESEARVSEQTSFSGLSPHTALAHTP